MPFWAALAVHFNTSRFSGQLRPATFTISSLRAGGIGPSFTPPLAGRDEPGFHHFGDTTFRVKAAADSPRQALRHSIHCETGAACVVQQVSRPTASACGAACGSADACACWSYATAPGTCYLLSNATALPVPDAAATCGWKRAWKHSGYERWTQYSSAAGGGTAVTPLPLRPHEIAAVDLGPALAMGAAGAAPARVVRRLAVDPGRGDLLLRFEVQNPAQGNLELAAFGTSMVFDQIFTGRSLVQVAEESSFTDPCISLRAGYVTVVSTTGRGPVLLLLPEPDAGAPQPGIQAWRMLTEDPTPRSVTFEGFYELMELSSAWAAQEWRGVLPWNPATALTLPPNGSATFAYRITTAPSVDAVEETLLELGRPVVSANNGYVISMPSQSGTAAVRVRRRCPGAACRRVVNASLTGGAPLALCVATGSSAVPGVQACTAAAARWLPTADETAVELRLISPGTGLQGRARLEVLFGDGTSAVIQLFLQADAPAVVQSHADFLRVHQFRDAHDDAFHRTAALMNWDRDRGAQILQEARAWIAGLSDECGAGPGVYLASKVLFAPHESEVQLLDRYVHSVLWGSEASRAAGWTVQSNNYGVRASMFFSGLEHFNYTVEPCWDEARSKTLWRSYNYPW